MIGLVYVPAAGMSSTEVWVFACLCAFLPALMWAARAPRCRRILLALIGALLLSVPVAAAFWDPPDWCCQDLLPYGLCWIPWWC